MLVWVELADDGVMRSRAGVDGAEKRCGGVGVARGGLMRLWWCTARPAERRSLVVEASDGELLLSLGSARSRIWLALDCCQLTRRSMP